MKKIIAFFLILSCSMALLAAPAKPTASKTKTQKAVPSILFDGKNFYLQYISGNSQQWLNEYLPKGQNFNNYTEMLTARSYDAVTATPEQIGRSIIVNLLKTYPKTPYNFVKGIHPDEVEISFAISGQLVDEFNLFRIIPGKNGHPIALQYVRRAVYSPSDTQEQIEQKNSQLTTSMEKDFNRWLKALRTLPVPKMQRTPQK